MAASSTEDKQIISQLRRFAALSRLALIVLQVLSNWTIPDHHADAFRSPSGFSSGNLSVTDRFITALLGGFARWDSQYFLHIAVNGYTHENCLAFFPLFPLLCKVGGMLVSLVSAGYVSDWNACLLAAILINTCLFTIAVTYVFKITFMISRNSSFAYLTAVFCCFSPASIFFIAPYTETLFFTLTLLSIYHCLEGRFARAAVFVGLSGIVRSNGLVNIGFLLYYSSAQFVRSRKCMSLVILIVSLVISVAPFLAFQFWAYREFCINLDPTRVAGINGDLGESILKGSAKSAWCNYSIPLSYSYVQSKYWDVGFLKYYQFKQLPNFILAIPMFFYCVRYLWSRAVRRQRDVLLAYFPFAVHATFLLVFCLFFVHIQVTTRLMSSASLVVYWSAAASFPTFKLNARRTRNLHFVTVRWNGLNKLQRSIILYFLLYTVIGTIFFTNYLPWT